MSWNAMTYEGKDTVLRVVETSPKASSNWRRCRRRGQPGRPARRDVRDIVGHIVDTTETYFEGFDAARSHADVDPAYGLAGMAKRAEEQGKSFRDMPRRDGRPTAHRLRQDDGHFRVSPAEDWTGLMVPHFYMGPRAGVLLSGVPADGLRDPLLGHSREAPDESTACTAMSRTCSCRSCSGLGRNDSRHRHRAVQYRRTHHNRTQRW